MGKNENFGEKMTDVHSSKEKVLKGSILVIALNGIGNTLLASPFISSLKKGAPHSHVAVLALADSAGALRGNTSINEVIVYPGKENIFSRLKFLISLRKRDFDFSFYVYPNVNIMSALIGIIIGAKSRVNFSYKLFGAWCTLFNTISIKPNLKKHDVEKNLDLLSPFGINSSIRKIAVFSSTEDEKKIDGLLKGKVVKGNILIGMHVGSKESMRIWPTENFAKMVRLLSTHKNLKIALVGTRIEEGLIEGFKEFSSKNIINLINKTTIPQTTEVIRRCKVFVTTDSGPMHMAVAARTKVIAIYLGPHIMRTAPYGKEHVAFVTNKSTKSMDNNKNHLYVDSITPEMVTKKTFDLLGKRKKKEG